jgi:molybdopterin-guanine dinucleotide biosynthesis protein
MKIICITAAASKLGKTTLIQKLIPHLDNWAVCKVTTCVRHAEDNCPRGHEETCGICNNLDLPYVLIEDAAVIAVPGTDTGKYTAAGAAKVVWIQSRPEFLKEALQEVLNMLVDIPGVIFEGNHVLKYLVPDISIMMTAKNGQYKQSAIDVRDSVDLFIEDWDFEKAVDEVRKRFS